MKSDNILCMVCVSLLMVDKTNTVEESYAFDEPTPAYEVVTLGKNAPQGAGNYIIRTGEPPIKVNGGSRTEQFR